MDSNNNGQPVLLPSNRKDVNEMIKDMIEAAKRLEADEVDHFKNSGGEMHAFPGAGYVLGSTCNYDLSSGEHSAKEQFEPPDITVRMWVNGFSVDDGDLREYSNSHNKDFLDTIRNGIIPMELQHKANECDMHVKLENHSHRVYTPIKATVQNFPGTRFRLRNVSQDVPALTTNLAIERNDGKQKIASEEQFNQDYVETLFFAVKGISEELKDFEKMSEKMASQVSILTVEEKLFIKKRLAEAVDDRKNKLTQKEKEISSLQSNISYLGSNHPLTMKAEKSEKLEKHLENCLHAQKWLLREVSQLNKLLEKFDRKTLTKEEKKVIKDLIDHDINTTKRLLEEKEKELEQVSEVRKE